MSCVLGDLAIHRELTDVSQSGLKRVRLDVAIPLRKVHLMAFAPTNPFATRRTPRLAAACLSAALLFTSCAVAEGATTAVVDGEIAASIDGISATNAITAVSATSDLALFDSSVVHDIDVSFDQDAYDEMIEIFTTTSEKEWIEATVTIDGTTFVEAGIRLKGNSSLFGLTTATSGNPEDLPWLIRLDKYVDDQAYQGLTDIVIRSTSSETAMNEAVAQDLLAAAGLANQDPIATTFTVNGGETELRLAIEHPDDVWDDANFDNDDGLLYKADSTGDYSYRGDDPDSYDDIFNQKAGDDDLEPLIEFLDFINNTDDATFADQLDEQLDIEAFATYLAFQDLVSNADDINGRGNNSYLHYDEEADMFTVVNWDLNLAFGQANVTGGTVGGNTAGQRQARPDGAALGGAALGGAAVGGAGGPGDQPNVLVDRFLANDDFAALYDAAVNDLTESLFDSGLFDTTVERWAEVLVQGASDVVDSTTILAEASVLLNYTVPTL